MYLGFILICLGYTLDGSRVKENVHHITCHGAPRFQRSGSLTECVGKVRKNGPAFLLRIRVARSEVSSQDSLVDGSHCGSPDLDECRAEQLQWRLGDGHVCFFLITVNRMRKEKGNNAHNCDQYRKVLTVVFPPSIP